MGQQPSPSPEELEFIFECFTRGLSDSEVLDEMGDTEFPVRKVRFIRDRRREFNAAKKVLETTLKQQVDPALIKARDNHLTEIRNLIEAWKDALKTPRIDEVSLQTTRLTRSIEVNPLFECLKQHLPYQTLWKDYSSWVDRFDDYLLSSKSLINKMSEDPNVTLALGKATAKVNITASDFLKTLLWPLAEGSRQYKEGASLDSIRKYLLVLLFEGIFGGFDDGFEQASKLEKVVFGEYWQSELGMHVMALFDELTFLEVKVQEALQKILLRQDYVVTYCGLCPGQAK